MNGGDYVFIIDRDNNSYHFARSNFHIESKLAFAVTDVEYRYDFQYLNNPSCNASVTINRTTGAYKWNSCDGTVLETGTCTPLKQAF